MSDEDEIMTVDSLIRRLTNLSENGYENFIICCLDAPLHEDEFGVNVENRCVNFHGYLFHTKEFERINELEKDIKKAINKYWRRKNENNNM